MKFLCVCHYGHSRSAAMARVLHARGHEAVAAGRGTSPSVIPVLAGWADWVVFMGMSFLVSGIPPAKIRVYEVGPDRWSDPYNQELLKLCGEFADSQGW